MCFPFYFTFYLWTVSLLCFLWLLSINWFLIFHCFLLCCWKMQVGNKVCVYKRTNWFVWPLASCLRLQSCIIRELYFILNYTTHSLPTYPLHYYDPYNKSDFFHMPTNRDKNKFRSIVYHTKNTILSYFGQYTSTVHLK